MLKICYNYLNLYLRIRKFLKSTNDIREEKRPIKPNLNDIIIESFVFRSMGTERLIFCVT